MITSATFNVHEVMASILNSGEAPGYLGDGSDIERRFKEVYGVSGEQFSTLLQVLTPMCVSAPATHTDEKYGEIEIGTIHGLAADGRLISKVLKTKPELNLPEEDLILSAEDDLPPTPRSPGPRPDDLDEALNKQDTGYES